MAINKKLISFATQAQFTIKLNAGDIDHRSIVFIEDEKRIWTHGVFFDTSWDYVTDTPDTLDGYGITDAAKKINSLYYVEGNTAGTAGAWTGSVPEVTSLYAGLTIAYKIGVAGASTTNLNLNGLGNKLVRRATGNLTTHLPVGTIVLLTYDGTRWVWADYDSNTTYAAMSVAEGTAGTVTTLRTMRADYLKQIVEHHIANTVPSAHTLGSHSDVTITSNSTGEILRWNGTNWINNTLAEAGIASTGQLNNYLPLTGGTLSNSGFGESLTIHRIAANNSTIKFTATSGNPWYIGMDVVTGEFGVVNSAVGITTSKVKLNGSSGLVTGTGFSKTGATDAHVLLGSGGHKAISDFNTSLVTSTTTSGTTNVATSNTNTYLNIVQGGSSVGSSTQIVGSNGITVASDTTGKLTITGLGAHAGVYSSRANGSGASSNSIEAKDTRSINPLPNTDLQRGVWFDFKTSSAIGLTGASTYSSVITMVPYGDNSGNSNASFRLAQSKDNLYFQNWTTAWGSWNTIYHSGNFANGTTSQYIRGDGSLATYATYSAGTKALLQSGTDTTNRVWSSKTLKDWYLEEIDLLLDSDRFTGSTFSSNVIDLTNVNGAFNVNSVNNYTTYTLSNKKVRGAWARVLVNTSLPITITGVKLINLGSDFELNTNMYLNVMYDGVDTLGYYTKVAGFTEYSYYISTSSDLVTFTITNTSINRFNGNTPTVFIERVNTTKDIIKTIYFADEYSRTTDIGLNFLYDFTSLTSADLGSMTNITGFRRGFLFNTPLKTLKMGAIVPPSLVESLPATLTSILVPSSAVNAYKSATYWSQRASVITGY